MSEPKLSVAKMAANGVSFYVGWFACVGFAAMEQPGLGIGVALAVIVIQLLLSCDWRRDLTLVCCLMALGLVLDSLYIYLGILSFTAPNPLANWLAPLWILPLYGMFGATFNSSLSYLRGHSVLLSALGSLGGPLCYVAGARMGAAVFPLSNLQGVLTVAFLWALLMPVVDRFNLYLGKRLAR